jgi:hypothetical protein
VRAPYMPFLPLLVVFFSGSATAQFSSSPPQPAYALPTSIEETNRLIAESDRFAAFVADELPWVHRTSPECAALARVLEYNAVPQQKVKFPASSDPTTREQELVDALQRAEEAMMYRHASLTEIIFRGLRLGCLNFPKTQSDTSKGTGR